MDMSLLSAFREVAGRGSITAAAEALGYTQSAVSRQIAALEDDVGARRSSTASPAAGCG